MTTKQEIIDFIENKLQIVKLDKLGKFVINSEFASKELIQMIKNLKPMVKKMGWVKFGNSLVSTGVDEEYVIDPLSKSNLVVINKRTKLQTKH